MEEITAAINRQLEEDFGGSARLRYVDFDSADLSDYPDIKAKVEAGELEPGFILVDSGLTPIWNIPYSQMVNEFEQKGAHRVSRKVS